MSRRALLCLGLLAAAAPVLVTAPASASPTTTATTSATAVQGNARHDGASTDQAFALPLAKAWSKDLGGPVSYPLIVGHRLFVTAGLQGSSGSSAAAYDLDTGKRLWGPFDMGGSGLRAITYDQGRVYHLNGSGVLTALDAATGARLWTAQVTDQYSFNAAPTAAGGRVYVGGSGEGGDLYAFDGATGRLLWERPVMNGDDSAPTVGGGRVYVSYACEQTYAFDPESGSQLWHHDTACEGGGGETSVFHGGKLYVRDNFGASPTVLDAATGAPVGAFTSATTPAVSDTSTITQSGGVVRGLATRTGAIRWTDTSRSWVSAPLIVSGHALVADSSGTLVALDAVTGKHQWSGSAGGAVSAGELAGLAEAAGHVAVPTGNRITVFRSAS